LDDDDAVDVIGHDDPRIDRNGGKFVGDFVPPTVNH
jgi:hypothetical protein